MHKIETFYRIWWTHGGATDFSVDEGMKIAAAFGTWSPEAIIRTQDVSGFPCQFRIGTIALIQVSTPKARKRSVEFDRALMEEEEDIEETPEWL